MLKPRQRRWRIIALSCFLAALLLLVLAAYFQLGSTQ